MHSAGNSRKANSGEGGVPYFSYQGETKDLQARVLYERETKEFGENLVLKSGGEPEESRGWRSKAGSSWPEELRSGARAENAEFRMGRGYLEQGCQTAGGLDAGVLGDGFAGLKWSFEYLVGP